MEYSLASGGREGAEADTVDRGVRRLDMAVAATAQGTYSRL